MRTAYLVVTGGVGRLPQTVGSIPKGSRILVLDRSLFPARIGRLWNEGIHRLFGEGFEFVVVMDEDVVIDVRTAKFFIEAISTVPSKVQPAPVLVTGFNVRAQIGEKLRAERVRETGASFQPGPRLDFSCFGVHLNTLRLAAGGKFDETYETAFYCGYDLARRLRVAGYGCYSYAPVWHFGETDDRDAFDRQVFIDERRYRSLWGGPIGGETTIIPGVLPLSHTAEQVA